MTGHVRPTVALIRTWFLLIGITLVLCAINMFDLQFTHVVAAQSDGHTSMSIMR